MLINSIFNHIYYFRVIKQVHYIQPWFATAGLKILLLLTSLFVSISTSYSQQPAYFMLGEQQFRGTQIYDVIQDNDLNYWFATDDGIYYYNYYSYKRVECDKAKSNAIFNFVIDNDGNIYCHNLNHQVFRIKDKKCSLFHELDNSERTSYMSLSISNEGEVVIGAKNILILDKSGRILKRKYLDKSVGHAYTLKSKEIIFYLNGNDSLITYKNGIFSQDKLHHTAGSPFPGANLNFFHFNGAYYAIDFLNKERFLFDYEKLELKKLPKDEVLNSLGFLRLYETSKGVWAASSITGVVLLPIGRERETTARYYNNYFISHVYEDKEGNILLSTFDKGLLVIPDINLPDVINTFEDDPITSISSGGAEGLFLGSSKGKLMRYQGNRIIKIDTNGNRPIEGIYGSSFSDLILYDHGSMNFYDKKLGKVIHTMSGSLKAAVFISEKELYVGTNYGLLKVRREGTNKFTTKDISGMRSRIYALAYHPEQKCVYASTSNGLVMVDSSGQNSKITYNNEDVYPNSLCYSNGKIYVSTKKNGVLVISKGKVERTITPIVNGKAEELKKIIVHNNSIIANSSNGLFQFDMEGRLLKSIHTTFRFSTQNVIDLTFHNEDLWVSHSGGVQKTSINYKRDKELKPVAHIDRIRLNDKVLIDGQNNRFDSKQRKIEFTLSSPTLRDRENIHYEYRLIGYESAWNSNSYESNVITYNALAAGNYTLQVRVRNEDVYSPVVEYSFSIASPLYVRWYFLAAMALLFMVTVFFVYRWQLRRQRNKSRQINELNASKLTAIQSQMNPHFIFNSLNSIQDLILKGDVEHSYSYITTFSNLVRLTLNYSDKEFIDFEQEIKLLKLYLSLEKLRFKKDFTYSIETNNIADIKIPPMLIQPFIENSLVHGLLHKQGNKRLTITFKLTDVLICIIEDNGIGREKARAINQRQHSDHESFSGKAIRNRFEILSDVLGGKFHYSYEDIDPSKEDTGTRVTLTIPVKHNF